MSLPLFLPGAASAAPFQGTLGERERRNSGARAAAGAFQLQAQSREMLKSSRRCTSGLSFTAGASPRITGVGAAGAPGAWGAVPWVPAPGRAGEARGVLSARAGGCRAHLSSHRPSPALPTTPACWDRRCHPRILPSSLPVTSTHLTEGAFPPHPSMQDITSALPCPVSGRAGGAGVAVGGGLEPHSEPDPHSRLPPGSLPRATHIHMDIYTGRERASSPARPRGSPSTPPQAVRTQHESNGLE